MKKFAFINHCLNYKQLVEIFPTPLSNRVVGQWVRKFNGWLPPQTHLRFGPTSSTTGSTIEGIGILSPLLPQDFVANPHRQVLSHLQRAVRIAESFGAGIVGLGGFTSVFGNEGAELVKTSGVALTSGNTYTAALAIEGIRRAAQLLGRSLPECRLAVVGATGDIGSVCTKVLGKEMQSVRLIARNEKRLEILAQEVSALGQPSVDIVRRVSDGIKGADVILSAASSVTTIIEPEDLSSGTIICDIGYPANVAKSVLDMRNDVFVFEGGLASWSSYDGLCRDGKLIEFSPPRTLHGCFAETLILALEGRFENFSLGRGNITSARIEEISEAARKHGFSLAPFSYGGREYFKSDVFRMADKGSRAVMGTRSALESTTPTSHLPSG